MLIPLACSEKSLLCQYQESYCKTVAFITALLHVTRDVLDNRRKLELLGSETWPGFCGVLRNEDISSALVNLSLHVPRLAAALFNPHPNTALESLPALSLLSYLPPGYPNSRSPRSRIKGHGSISMIPN